MPSSSHHKTAFPLGALLRLAALGCLLAAAPLAADQGVTVIAYHHVGPLTAGAGPQGVNVFTVTPALLRSHFEVLRKGGYHLISGADYRAYLNGALPLPDRSVLLTFDDGYRSFAAEALPLLREFGFPAVLALVGSWTSGSVPPDLPDGVMDWNQIRALEKTGLVEIASHTYRLHEYLPVTAYGDQGPAVTNLEYIRGAAETPAAHREKIRRDLQAAQDQMRRELGHPARFLVWPYGEVNEEAAGLAAEAGFEGQLLLQGGFNLPGEATKRATRRGIVWGAPSAGEFARFLDRGGRDDRGLRAVQIDLDTLYDPNRAQMEKNIGLAIARLRRDFAESVFLQAFADEDGDGNVDQVYFATKAAPVKADVFAHVAARLTDAGYRVFAWVPTLAGQWLLKDHPEDRLTASDPKGAGWYRRATPFSPRVRASLEQLFDDLAAGASFDGILFQDDLYLTDYEDWSDAGQAAYRAEFHRDLTRKVQGDPAAALAWAKVKARALDSLTADLMDVVRRHRPGAAFARNIYSEAASDPAAEAWYAQDLPAYLARYDYTVVMAYPYMEKKSDRAEAWLSQLADTVLKVPGAAEKVVFKLQGYDWSSAQWIPRADLVRQMKTVLSRGVRHVAFYPENLLTSQPLASPF